MYLNGLPLPIDPCSSGTIYLSAANMYVPGTGNINLDQVINFKWLVPKGWSVGSQVSDGVSFIYSGQNVTVNYPASAIEGTIKVQGSIVVLGCTAETQESLACEPISVKREVNFTLNANKSSLLCGDTSPVTFTVSPASACAVYYWNNSQTPSTNNIFQVTPDGVNATIATVNIVYGGKTKSLSKTINYQLFDTGVTPYISGSNAICLGSNSTYTVTYLRPGYTVTYNKSSNLSISQAGNSCTLTSTGNGAGWLEATINTPCGAYPQTLHKDIWVGLPNKPVFEIVGPIECGFIYVVKNFNNESVTWSLRGPLRFVGPNVGYRCTFEATGSSDYGDESVTATIENECGIVSTTEETGPIECFDFLLTPNPASSDVFVSFQSEESTKSLSSKVLAEEEYNVRIFDNMGTVFYIGKKKGDRFSLPISNLKDGIYFVEVNSNKKSASKQLVVKH